MMNKWSGCGKPRRGNAYLEDRLQVEAGESLCIQDSRVVENRGTGIALAGWEVN